MNVFGGSDPASAHEVIFFWGCPVCARFVMILNLGMMRFDTQPIAFLLFELKQNSHKVYVFFFNKTKENLFRLVLSCINDFQRSVFEFVHRNTSSTHCKHKQRPCASKMRVFRDLEKIAIFAAARNH